MRLTSFFAALAVVLCTSSARGANEKVIELHVVHGDRAGRDSRVFGVDVDVNKTTARMLWGCSGATVVTESFAKKARLKVEQVPQLQAMKDHDGNEVFAGVVRANLEFGGKSIGSLVQVMHDGYAVGMADGSVGYDLASQFQWMVTPDAEKPTLRLRQPGFPLPQERIAILPIFDENHFLQLKITVRGTPTNVALMPQSPDMQVGPALQRKWDFAKSKDADIEPIAGPVRAYRLTGKDAVKLASDVVETSVRIVLMGKPDDKDPPGWVFSGVGASLLNRYTYLVDPKFKKFILVAKSEAPDPAPNDGEGKPDAGKADKPATQPDKPKPAPDKPGVNPLDR